MPGHVALRATTPQNDETGRRIGRPATGRQSGRVDRIGKFMKMALDFIIGRLAERFSVRQAKRKKGDDLFYHHLFFVSQRSACLGVFVFPREHLSPQEERQTL